ncbi:Uncharacterised protein [uncultured archaeon]|nr:Uncharacterised protein [uncultured archaeon]
MVDITGQKYLFVCFENINRSPMGAEIFSLMLRYRGYKVGDLNSRESCDYYVGSAGVCVNKEKTPFGVQLEESMLEGLDTVFIANDLEEWFMVEKMGISKRANWVVLGIKDNYDIGVDSQARELEAILRTKLVEHLPRRRIPRSTNS